MEKIVFKFNDEFFIDVSGNRIDVRDGLVYAYNGENVVAVAKLEAIVSVSKFDSMDVSYFSKKSEEK